MLLISLHVSLDLDGLVFYLTHDSLSSLVTFQLNGTVGTKLAAHCEFPKAYFDPSGVSFVRGTVTQGNSLLT